MHKLIEFACDELEQLEKKAAKGSLSAAEVEYADKLASLKKNLLKGDMLYQDAEEGYSGNTGSYSRGNQGGNRGGNRGGSSNRGGSYEGSYEGAYDGSYDGSYARRGRGRNARRDSMGRYSTEEGYSRGMDDMLEQLNDLEQMAPDEQTRKELKRMMQRMEQMPR